MVYCTWSFWDNQSNRKFFVFQEVFDWVVNPGFSDVSGESELNILAEIAGNRTEAERSAQQVDNQIDRKVDRKQIDGEFNRQEMDKKIKWLKLNR